MSSAGQQMIANRIPGERIAVTVATSNSANITADAVTDTVVAPLVSGRTYKIKFVSNVSGGAAERALVRIREDNLTGTTLQTNRMGMVVATSYPIQVEAEYTAVATGNKTFVVTIVRETAVANVVRVANATQPTRLYVEYVSG